MNTLWVFGDSFSDIFRDDDWSKKYVQYKGYVPKTFGQIISEDMGMSVNNQSYSGSDNDTMYETICQCAPQIRKDDIIIIGWSSIQRFRLPHSPNKWMIVMPNTEHNLYDNYEVPEDVMQQITYLRSLPNYIDEYKKRRNFLNWLFKDNILIHWTPFYHQFNYMLGFGNINTIKMETHNVVDDSHYSELGHQQLSVKLMEVINNDKWRQEINNMEKKIL